MSLCACRLRACAAAQQAAQLRNAGAAIGSAEEVSLQVGHASAFVAGCAEQLLHDAGFAHIEAGADLPPRRLHRAGGSVPGRNNSGPNPCAGWDCCSTVCIHDPEAASPAIGSACSDLLSPCAVSCTARRCPRAASALCSTPGASSASKRTNACTVSSPGERSATARNTTPVRSRPNGTQLAKPNCAMCDRIAAQVRSAEWSGSQAMANNDHGQSALSKLAALCLSSGCFVGCWKSRLPLERSASRPEMVRLTTRKQRANSHGCEMLLIK